MHEQMSSIVYQVGILCSSIMLESHTHLVTYIKSPSFLSLLGLRVPAEVMYFLLCIACSF